MTLVVPRAPDALALPIERRWDGPRLRDARLHAAVRLSAGAGGLALAARSGDPRPPRVPAAPPGSRVPGLWHYDVVECFLVGAWGRYLELELGADGHFLALSFDGPRRLVAEHADFRPRVRHARGAAGWEAALTVPWPLVPRGLRSLNAFAVSRGVHRAYHPLPGDAPDFHQPARHPAARLAGGPDPGA